MARNRKALTAKTVESAQSLSEMPRPGVPRLELTGNTELLVEGCKGVAAYAEEEIRLNLGALVLAVSGADLTMRALRLEECVITGRIATLSLMNNE